MTDIITLYQTLTGKTIPAPLVPQYEAWGNRAIAVLENKLGWSFTDEPEITLAGISPRGCDCDVATEDLLPAPEIKGSCRFFSFNDKQPYAMTDPFTKIHAVYLCRVEPEGKNITTVANEVVILKKIEDVSPKYVAKGVGKYIKACNEITACQSLCEKDCLNCSALLVDADWLPGEEIPTDLAYLICDYIDWMATGGPENRSLRAERVDGHSVEYYNWRGSEPLLNDADRKIILLYAGPYGEIDRKLIW